jgi:serine/threonine-protein kinase
VVPSWIGVLATGETIIGKYRIVRLIGEGGMGEVYEGRDLRLDRPVAIKLLHAALSKDRELIARFEREARAAAKVNSPHIVDVFDFGDLPNGDRFMVMELLEGESLFARLKTQRRLPPHETAQVGIQLLEGLIRVHDAGIIHRDLKPANVFLSTTANGGLHVRLLDFGVCKVAESHSKDAKTELGDLLGTLPYMAPEHLEQGASLIDARGDLYFVGVILYRCVTGRLPYSAANLFDLIKQMRAAGPPPVCDVAPDVDGAFARIVDTAIDWDLKARYKDARELQRALLDWTTDRARVERLLESFLDPGELRADAPAPPGPATEEAPTTRYKKPQPPAGVDPDDADTNRVTRRKKGRTKSDDVAIEVELDDEADTIAKPAKRKR